MKKVMLVVALVEVVAFSRCTKTEEVFTKTKSNTIGVEKEGVETILTENILVENILVENKG